MQSVIPLWKQLEYYKEYQAKLIAYQGSATANETMKEALYVMSLGTNDFLENYYTMPGRSSQYNIQQYQDFLIGIAGGFIEKLHGLGARKISLGGLPPMGCLPLERTRNVFGSNDCMESYNNLAVDFNKKLEALTVKLNKDLPDIELVFSNPYYVLLQAIKKPSLYGNKLKLIGYEKNGLFLNYQVFFLHYRFWCDIDGMLCNGDIWDGLCLQSEQLIHLHRCKQVHILGLISSHSKNQPNRLWVCGQERTFTVSLITPLIKFKILEVLKLVHTKGWICSNGRKFSFEKSYLIHNLHDILSFNQIRLFKICCLSFNKIILLFE